jgi:hypothetical protein
MILELVGNVVETTMEEAGHDNFMRCIDGNYQYDPENSERVRIPIEINRQYDAEGDMTLVVPFGNLTKLYGVLCVYFLERGRSYTPNLQCLASTLAVLAWEDLLDVGSPRCWETLEKACSSRLIDNQL